MFRNVKTITLICLFITSSAFSQETTMDTIAVDFGSNLSEGIWNNLSDGAGAGEIPMLKNSRGLYTGIGINVYDQFSGINTSGTTTPDSGVDFPSTATSDSYYGSSGTTGGVLISGLDPNKDYTFEVFASRSASDNREAKYRFEGATEDSVFLDAASNSANTVSVTMKPNADGEIDLIVSPGPNNDNSSKYFYLGALKIVYEEEEALPAAITVTTPNGGEELTGGTNYSVSWEAINLMDDIVVSYSTDGGSSWIEIATVANDQASLSWSVPDIATSTGLIQVVSGSVNDQSDSEFSITAPSGIAYDTVMVDFGSNLTEGVWNDLSDGSGAGEITSLKNSRDLFTDIGINVYDQFNGINTGGTTSPDANLGFPSSATSDSYYGNTVTFADNTEPTGGLLITGLNPDKEYTIEVFASRAASDNRETKYRFEGATSDSVLLNPSDNTSNTVSVTLKPNTEGSIDLVVSPGPNNDNSYEFYYLGALKIVYEQEEVLLPGITLLTPNGGEELMGGRNYTISWEAINLEDDIVVSYSTDEGSSWNDISTVASDQTSLSWSVPDITSYTSLVQVVSGSVSDQSDSVFTIMPVSDIAYDTVKVDFGSNESGDGWNNFLAGDGTGEIPTLINSVNEYTGFSVTIFDRFNGVNTNGTSNADPNLYLTSTATSDSYYGNTAEWASRTEPTAGLLFTGLTVDKDYTFEIFASRMSVSDSRETKYKFTGSVTDSVYLDPANNETEIATITLQPAADGSITLEVSAGENNTNSYQFYYLGALKLIYEQEFSPFVSVTSPNGGEEWTIETTQEISWISNQIDSVDIEFSVDNGASWTSYGTTDASTGTFEWTVPNVDTDSALIRISDYSNPAIYDVSNGVFSVDIPVSGEFRPLIVVLGSSTAAGSGATIPDSAWVWRYRNYVQSLDAEAYVLNLAVGGYTSYDVMPSDFTPPSDRPAPETENNITKALTYSPWAVIINLPSNDAASNFTIEEQVFNMRTITETADAAEVPVWVMTTQPRNLNESQLDNLIEMRDSILTIYGDNAINVFDSLANEDGTLNSAFDSGDGVHLNDTGHKFISDKVIDTGVWETINNIVIDDIEEDGLGLPTSFSIANNYPNPFNPSTNIEFSLPVSSTVEIRVFDITGREVSVLASGKYSAGQYSVAWDASGFATGMYIYRITAQGDNNTSFSRSMKMMLIK